jgi:hypothetical protein
MNRRDGRRPNDTAELDRIADMMRARIFDLVRGPWGLSHGYQDGHDWVCCNPLRADHKPGSFRISLSGPLQGLVIDFAGEAFPGAGRQSVSPLSFHLALCHPGDRRGGINWIKDWLGLSGKDPVALQATHQAVQQYTSRPDQSAEAVARRRKMAKAIFLKAGSIVGSPGEAYLAGRGIHLDRLGYPVNALRFEPHLYCSELGTWDNPEAHVPGIVMPINAMNGDLVGIHRIWIAEVEPGQWIKHPGIRKAKKALAPYAGGVIRLWNGLRVDETTGEIRYGQDFRLAKGPLRVHVAEGPETALSVAMGCPEERVHCAVSVSNLAGLAYPDKVTDIVLWRDADPPGSAAAIKFQRAVNNMVRQGKRVYVADVSTVAPGAKDANDVLNGKLS